MAIPASPVNSAPLDNCHTKVIPLKIPISLTNAKPLNNFDLLINAIPLDNSIALTNAIALDYSYLPNTSRQFLYPWFLKTVPTHLINDIPLEKSSLSDQHYASRQFLLPWPALYFLTIPSSLTTAIPLENPYLPDQRTCHNSSSSTIEKPLDISYLHDYKAISMDNPTSMANAIPLDNFYLPD